MSNWRTRGYVPDSDDEDESLSIQQSVPRDKAEDVDDRLSKAASVVEQTIGLQEKTSTTHSQNTDSSTAEKLERVLSHGLQTVRNVLATSPSAVVLGGDDHDNTADDSPLSSPPSSHPGSPLISATPRLESIQNRQRSDILQQAVNEALAASAPRRNLRTRAPIQQHPYMLEDAQYRQQMKDRGLRPVIVPTVSKNADQDGSRDESQVSADVQSSQMEDSYDLNKLSQISDVDLQQPIEAYETSQSMSEGFDDHAEDGLLDLSMLLRQRNLKTIKTYKPKGNSQRTAVPSATTDTTSTDIFDIPEVDELVRRGSVREPHFRVPPSPPHSDTNRNADDVDDDEDVIPASKINRRLNTPGSLPTPLMSSDHAYRKRSVAIIESSESSQSEEDDDASATLSEAEEDDSQGLKWMRHKLKGVLPPSFLRLDMQTRAENRPRPRPPPIPTTPALIERGVARRTVSKPSRPPREHLSSLQALEPDYSSSGENEDSNFATGDLFKFSASRPIVAVSDDESHGTANNVVEENEIDRMFPSTRQPRMQTQPRKQRQTRIDNGWAVSNRRTAADAASAGLISQSRSKAQGDGNQPTLTKRRKVRHRRQRMIMSVSDAPGLREMERKVQPTFLKVAARQAKREPSDKTHFQAKKIFVLATEEDTRDVNDQLQAWRRNRSRQGVPKVVEGANLSKTQAVRVFQNTLPAPSARESSTRLDSTTQIEELKRSTKALLSKPTSSQRNLVHESSLPKIITHTDSATGENPHFQTLRLRALFAHRNRSGRGLFLHRPPNPRTAQLESPVPAFSPITGVPLRTVVKTIGKARPRPVTDSGQPKASVHAETADTNPIKRAPKKQIPRKSKISTAKMDTSNPLDAPDAPLPDVGVELAIAPVLEAVAALQLLQVGARFRGSIVSNDYLHKVTERITTQSYNTLTATNNTSSITSPISRHQTTSGVCDIETRLNISTVLDETFTNFCEQFTRSVDQCQSCVTSVREILHYLGHAAYFNTTIDVENFVRDTKLWIEKFLAHFDDGNFPQDAAKRAVLTDCLNHLSVLMLYIHDLANTTFRDFALPKETKELCLRLVDRITTITYEHTTLVNAVSRLSDMYEDFWPSLQSFPEADSVVIRWYTHQILSADGTDKYFYSHLKSILSVKKTPNRSNQLNSCLLALCFTLPLVKFNTLGQLHRDIYVVKDVEGECFSLLVEHVEGITKGPAASSVSNAVGPLLEAVEDMCLKMTKIWEWNPAPVIITALWQAYVWNSWLPFHSVMPPEDIFEILRKPSHQITYTNDNDCYKFFELVELCITSLCQSRSDTVDTNYTPEPGKVKSLVFKLLPNQAEEFSAQSTIPVHRLLALKNMFALRIKIFTVVPDAYRPRLQDLKTSVDFSSSHGLVCKLALAAWKSIALFNIEQISPGRETVRAAGEWMNSILQQSLAYLQQNRLEAVTRVTDILSTFTYVLRHCNSEPKSRILFYSESVNVRNDNVDKFEVREVLFGHIEQILNKPEIHRHNDEIMILSVRLLLAYVKSVKDSPVHGTLITKAQVVLKNLMQRVLGKNHGYSDSLVRSVMEAWFAIAHIMVSTFHKHWNDFVVPHSNLSIDFLAGLRESYSSYEAKACFFSDLIKADTTYYYLECRPIVFITWVATLLFPVQRMRFGHVLTNSILSMERESLMIGALAQQLFEDSNSRELDKQALADCRIVILRHIIQNIHGQQDMTEEEWLAGGLDFEAMRTLLRTMTRTMKDQWLELKPYPDAQNDYTALIYAILNELETYPVTGFKIDPWFSGNSEFPRPILTFDNVFMCRLGESAKPINYDLVRNFVQQYKREVNVGREEELIQEWLRIFHCTDPLRSQKRDGVIQYSIDIAKQENLVRVVVPAFLEYVREANGSSFVNPLFRWLTTMTSGIAFRIDSLRPDNMKLHIATVASVLRAVCLFFEATHLRHLATVPMLKYTRAAMATVVSLCEYGIEIEEELYECCMGNILGIYAVVVYHMDKLLEDHEKKAAAVPPQTRFDEETIVSPGFVVGKWENPPVENFELVPDKESWTLRFDPAEPELSEEEEGWRKKAVSVLLEGGRPRGKGGLREMPWGFGDREEMRREMMGFLRELKEMELVEMGEEDSEEE